MPFANGLLKESILTISTCKVLFFYFNSQNKLNSFYLNLILSIEQKLNLNHSKIRSLKIELESQQDKIVSKRNFIENLNLEFSSHRKSIKFVRSQILNLRNSFSIPHSLEISKYQIDSFVPKDQSQIRRFEKGTVKKQDQNHANNDILINTNSHQRDYQFIQSANDNSIFQPDLTSRRHQMTNFERSQSLKACLAGNDLCQNSGELHDLSQQESVFYANGFRPRSKNAIKSEAKSKDNSKTGYNLKINQDYQMNCDMQSLENLKGKSTLGFRNEVKEKCQLNENDSYLQHLCLDFFGTKQRVRTYT